MNEALLKINEASKDLLYLSEADYSFDVITIEKPSLSLEQELGILAGKGPEAHIERVTLEHFFRNMVKVYPNASSEQQKTAQRFQQLLNVLKEELRDVTVYRIGEVEIDAFIIGLLPDGTYAGLRTKVIET